MILALANWHYSVIGLGLFLVLLLVAVLKDGARNEADLERLHERERGR